METYWFPNTEKRLFRALEISFSLPLICVSIFISVNEPLLLLDVENVIEVSPPPSSPSQQTTMPADAVLSSSLSQTTGWTKAALKPKVSLKQDEFRGGCRDF